MALMVGAAEVSVYVLHGNCLTCGTKNEIVGYNQLIPHPTVYYKEDGSYYCPVCGYNMD